MRTKTRRRCEQAYAAVLVFVVLAAALVLPRLAPDQHRTPSAPNATATTGIEDAAAVERAVERATDVLPRYQPTAEQERRYQQETTQPPLRAVAVPGRDGYVFLGDLMEANLAQAVGRRVYSDAELIAMVAAVRGRQAWLRSRGSALVFAIAPAKWSIYPEKLPEWTDGMGGPHSLDLLLAAEPELPWVDLRPQLRQGRATADTYSPLNSHWTDFGAYVALAPLYAALQAAAPSVGQLTIPALAGVDVVDQGNEFEALAGITGLNPWTVPRLSQQLPSYDVIDAHGQRIHGAQQADLDPARFPLRTECPGAPNDHRLLVLADSSAGNLAPYLATTFTSTMMLHHRIDAPEQAPDLIKTVEQYRPDLVLYLVSERNLNRPFDDGPGWAAANSFDALTRPGRR